MQEMAHALAAVIPAYRPGRALVELAAALAGPAFAAVIVVDDGSGPDYAAVFAEAAARPGVTVVRHAVNLGKGAALKTGFNHALCAIPGLAGVVTADADGQHAPEDVLRVAECLRADPARLVLGARSFRGAAPWRSRWGNRMAALAARLLLGQPLTDTQTGLRGVPAALLPGLLRVPSTGYEFELDMLIAARHQGCAVREVPIRTLYEPGNPGSHFNPLLDSMRVSFVLLRFSLLALATAAVDNLVFLLVFGATGQVAGSQVAARVAGVAVNYGGARRAVFLSRESHRVTLPRYLALVAASGTASYALIQLLAGYAALPVIGAKLLAESLLFLANFAIQRDFVFIRRAPPGGATDWDRYYRATPWTARLTRRYTQRVLLRALERFAPSAPRVAELGGAGSTFLPAVIRRLRPREYHVVDSNAYGLELLRRRVNGLGQVRLHLGDCRDTPAALDADVAFSIGLIEHFPPAETRRVIERHFALLVPGGCAVISFPTPTWLYRAARALAEAAGLWSFPDERPLSRAEVAATVEQHGQILFETVLWPLVFTQRLIVARKSA
jgi:glycosyltransferase involved in cell wall biosynthesis